MDTKQERNEETQMEVSRNFIDKLQKIAESVKYTVKYVDDSVWTRRGLIGRNVYFGQIPRYCCHFVGVARTAAEADELAAKKMIEFIGKAPVPDELNLSSGERIWFHKMIRIQYEYDQARKKNCLGINTIDKDELNHENRKFGARLKLMVMVNLGKNPTGYRAIEVPPPRKKGFLGKRRSTNPSSEGTNSEVGILTNYQGTSNDYGMSGNEARERIPSDDDSVQIIKEEDKEETEEQRNIRAEREKQLKKKEDERKEKERRIQRVQNHVKSLEIKCKQKILALSASICERFEKTVQTSGIKRLKMDAVKKVQEQLKNVKDLKDDFDLMVFATGSTVNGCATFTSGLNLCVCLISKTTGNLVHARENEGNCEILQMLKKTLWEQDRRIVATVQLIDGSCPTDEYGTMLRGQFNLFFHGISFNINVNGQNVFDSYLIAAYSKLDNRFSPLALLIKEWGVLRGVCDASNGFLSSYALVLLLIHFLQCGVEPAVFPNLQKAHPEVFNQDDPVEFLKFPEFAESLPKETKNSSSIGSLFIGFFYYYDKFPFHSYVISIRDGEAKKKDTYVRDSINIEKPIGRALNVAERVTKMQYINEEFHRAVTKLRFENEGTALDDLMGF